MLADSPQGDGSFDGNGRSKNHRKGPSNRHNRRTVVLNSRWRTANAGDRWARKDMVDPRETGPMAPPLEQHKRGRTTEFSGRFSAVQGGKDDP